MLRSKTESSSEHRLHTLSAPPTSAPRTSGLAAFGCCSLPPVPELAIPFFQAPLPFPVLVLDASAAAAEHRETRVSRGHETRRQDGQRTDRQTAGGRTKERRRAGAGQPPTRRPSPPTNLAPNTLGTPPASPTGPSSALALSACLESNLAPPTSAGGSLRARPSHTDRRIDGRPRHRSRPAAREKVPRRLA